MTNPDSTVYRGRLRESKVVDHDRTNFMRLTIDVPLASLEDGKHVDTNFTSKVGVRVPIGWGDS